MCYVYYCHKRARCAVLGSLCSLCVSTASVQPFPLGVPETFSCHSIKGTLRYIYIYIYIHICIYIYMYISIVPTFNSGANRDPFRQIGAHMGPIGAHQGCIWGPLGMQCRARLRPLTAMKNPLGSRSRCRPINIRSGSQNVSQRCTQELNLRVSSYTNRH